MMGELTGWKEGSQLTQIVPQAFRLYDGPQSLPDETTISLCTSACHFIVECILRRYRSENKRKAKIRATPDDVRLESQEWLDLTDRENHDFVYSL
jgi:ACS family allantoate permease-like MFS transporter